jgi:hypothetical protein
VETVSPYHSTLLAAPPHHTAGHTAGRTAGRTANRATARVRPRRVVDVRAHAQEIEASAAEADAQPGLIASDGMSDTVLGSLSSAAGETVRAKLELLYDTADDADESDAPDGQR